MAESYDKSVSAKWQFNFGGAWTDFDTLHKGFNANLENNFKKGRTTCDLSAGWSNNFKIDLKKLTSTNQRGSKQSCKIRRWTELSAQDLKEKKRKEELDIYDKKAGASGRKLLDKYYPTGGKFQMKDFFKTDMKGDYGIFDPIFFAFFAECEANPFDITREEFKRGISRCRCATSPIAVETHLGSLLKTCKRDVTLMKTFIEKCYVVIARKGKRIHLKVDSSQRMDGGEAYDMKSFTDYYGEEAVTKWRLAKKVQPLEVKQIRTLLDFSIGGMTVIKGLPTLPEAWSEFLTEEKDDYTIGKDEWSQVYVYFKNNLKENFADFDPFVAPVIVQDFKTWMEKKAKDLPATSGGGGAKGEDNDDDLW
eukprot:g2730.t1